jgi:hypothetical protein
MLMKNIAATMFLAPFILLLDLEFSAPMQEKARLKEQLVVNTAFTNISEKTRGFTIYSEGCQYILSCNGLAIT